MVIERKTGTAKTYKLARGAVLDARVHRAS